MTLKLIMDKMNPSIKQIAIKTVPYAFSPERHCSQNKEKPRTSEKK